MKDIFEIEQVLFGTIDIFSAQDEIRAYDELSRLASRTPIIDSEGLYGRVKASYKKLRQGTIEEQKLAREALERLYDGLPLTPIYLTASRDWECDEFIVNDRPTKIMRCKRYPSLYATITRYDGVNRLEAFDYEIAKGYDIDNPGKSKTLPVMQTVVNQMFPVTFPYMPTKEKYTVRYEVTPEANRIYIVDIITPNGKKIDVFKFKSL